MKKTIITLIIIFILGIIGIWTYNYNLRQDNSQLQVQEQQETSKNELNYQAERSNTEITQKVQEQEEIEIASFSTKIYNKDKERQNNIGITCKALSTKEIQPGEIFSFCDTVGKATREKGYEEADIYVNGKKEQGLGGGNCQVSTTLYNAVLKVPELEVIERHKHSGKVPYIQSGKDAAVAYGTYDFKFKNNTDNIIKIVMENTTEKITAKIIKK